MRKSGLLLAAALAALGAAPAAAQTSMMTAQIIMSMMPQAAPAKCYDGRWLPKPAEIAYGQARADLAIRRYQELAAAGADVSEAFIKDVGMRHWLLDGDGVDVRAVRDPWIGRVATLAPVAFTAGNGRTSYHAQWKAIAADGTVLGLYDALLSRSGKGGDRLRWLDLHSPASSRRPMTNVPYCEEPGDVEEWKAAIAKREADKAAKRAAREAARADGGK